MLELLISTLDQVLHGLKKLRYQLVIRQLVIYLDTLYPSLVMDLE